MDQHKISQLNTINRALGIIEGVMIVSDFNQAEALGTAVEMIDEVIKEIFKMDGDENE